MSDFVAGAEKAEEAVVKIAITETAATESIPGSEMKDENIDAEKVPIETLFVQNTGEGNCETKIHSIEEAVSSGAMEEINEEHPGMVGLKAAQICVETSAETPTAASAKISDELLGKEATLSGAVMTAESPKTESNSPSTPRKPQKAAFNVDAKPFSPISLSDPALQASLVGEATGLSIKVGQWNPQPFVPIAHLSPTAPVNVGHIPYVAPALPPAPAVKKETTTGKDSLSAYAKPWSPHPEVTVNPIVAPDNEVAIHPGSWSAITVDGKEVIAPSPMVPRKSNTNLFAHSFSIHPKGLKTVELELLNYTCARCTLKTLYGRLSSRQPDVTMRNVSVDVPPLCIAHLIEQITKAKVTALHLNESEGPHYDIWLDKPNLSTQLVEFISGSLWATPMHHGYAVMGKNEEGKRYLRNYVERLRDSKPSGSNVYDVALVEVKEH
ncbi:hypothetical protein, conserved [Leishmania tarentolae]|uniref:Uncharacterized protein n=1 Tax=Leishmania tarentolae TaxID=5689 RepID=A0A640KEZ9_LEITA|nr:hypothetical protein, conserved [Leishmania tarentolae]